MRHHAERFPPQPTPEELDRRTEILAQVTELRKLGERMERTIAQLRQETPLARTVAEARTSVVGAAAQLFAEVRAPR